MASLQEQFDAAAEKARNTQNVSNQDKLKIYSLFKQATEGPIGDRPRPGIFDLTGRAKYDAWAALGDLSKEDAMTQYVEFIATL
eukprot:Nitzschia sp. Nitz4//scaffold230_size58257//16691//16942//NITZ4_006477-RA/size58257-processed-gene-0.60-mRNA-1//-1//CDS//3329543238//6033//frame0